MLKERSINPAQAQRKAEKAKTIKKSKAEAAARRNEKLAKRNPDRLQKQLDELKLIETDGGSLTNHEKNLRSGLEKELQAVLKARDSIGSLALKYGVRVGKGVESKLHLGKRGKVRDSTLGKRMKEGSESSEDFDVPDEVKRIPMPKDTPPPIPKEVLDKWYQKRRERKRQDLNTKQVNTNLTPIGSSERMITDSKKISEVNTESKPIIQAQTVYEAKPVIRDLRKEAVTFVPTVVQMKLDKSKAVGELLKSEETG